MNIKTISLVISLVLVLFIGGYIVIYDNTPDNNNNQTNFNDTTTVPDIKDNLSVPSDKLPPSVEKIDRYSYNINKNAFVKNHTSIVEAQSVTVLKSTNEYKKTVKKSGNKVYINKQGSNYKVEKYQTEKFTFTRYDSLSVEYDATRSLLSKNNYNLNKDLNLYIKSLELKKIRTTEKDNVLIYMGGSDNLEALGTTLNFGSINNTNALLTVNQNGLVKNIELTVVGESLGTTSSKTVEYNIRKLSDTDINEPDWVQDVRDSKSIVRTTLSSDDNIIKISHEGLSSVKSNTNITVVEEESTYNVTVNKEVTDGDDIFLAPTENGWVASVNNINVTGSRNINDKVDNIYYKYNGNTLFNIDF